MFRRKSTAITRTASIVIVIVLVVAAAAGVVYYSTLSSSSTTQLHLLGDLSRQSSVQTLTIDAAAWPIDNLNQLYALSELPWPNWLTYTVYQPLVFANETAEYGNREHPVSSGPRQQLDRLPRREDLHIQPEAGTSSSRTATRSTPTTSGRRSTGSTTSLATARPGWSPMTSST